MRCPHPQRRLSMCNSFGGTERVGVIPTSAIICGALRRRAHTEFDDGELSAGVLCARRPAIRAQNGISALGAVIRVVLANSRRLLPGDTSVTNTLLGAVVLAISAYMIHGDRGGY